MPEASPYFLAITDNRSIQQFEGDEQGALEGSQLLSIETTENEEKQAYGYIVENLPKFFSLLRLLAPENQELLLSYFMVGKPQTALAVIHRSTQTVVSQHIRAAVRELCFYIQVGGRPTQATIMGLLCRYGLDVVVEDKVFLGVLIFEYSQTRNFEAIANHYQLHRPNIRRAIRDASRALAKIDSALAKSFAAYLGNMIDKAGPKYGMSERKKSKSGDILRADPPVLGEFRRKINSPDFLKHCFFPRANR
jgi:hypothetical protein